MKKSHLIGALCASVFGIIAMSSHAAPNDPSGGLCDGLDPSSGLFSICIQAYSAKNRVEHLTSVGASTTAICKAQAELEKTIDNLIDRPLEQLDPVELGILLIGTYELETRIDIPYKVVINECVNLARRFGSVEGHKYINACQDVAAQSLRETEVQANTGG